MKRVLVLLLSLLLVFSLVACKNEPEPTPAPNPGPNPPADPNLAISVATEAQLKSAVIKVTAGGTITVTADIALTDTIVVDKAFTLTATTPVKISDGGLEVAATGFDGNTTLATMFGIAEGGKLTVSGSITFTAAEESKKIIVFCVGTKTVTDAELYLNSGVTISDVKTSMAGGVIRNFGKTTINGATIKNNNGTANGLIFLYNGGTFTVNSGSFKDNANTKNGLFCLGRNSEGTLIINDGTFEGNSANLGIIYSYSGNKAITINGGSFKENTPSGTNCALLYLHDGTAPTGTPQVAVAINGGSFTATARHIYLTDTYYKLTKGTGVSVSEAGMITVAK